MPWPFLLPSFTALHDITRCFAWYRDVNETIEALEPTSVAQIAQKFESFLETYRRPDGSRWGEQDLYKATGGVVTRS